MRYKQAVNVNQDNTALPTLDLFVNLEQTMLRIKLASRTFGRVNMSIYPALVAATLSTFAAAAATADSCEELRAEIEAKIRDAGVQIFSVKTVDAASDVPGEVVGSCGQGSRKIVYLKGAKEATAAAPAGASSSASPQVDRPAPAGQPGPDAILTECKPGFVSIRGDCKKL